MARPPGRCWLRAGPSWPKRWPRKRSRRAGGHGPSCTPKNGGSPQSALAGETTI